MTHPPTSQEKLPSKIPVLLGLMWLSQPKRARPTNIYQLNYSFDLHKETRKFYIRRNNNNKQSWFCWNKAHTYCWFASIKWFRNVHVHHDFWLTMINFYRHYLVYKYNFTCSLFWTTFKLTNDIKILREISIFRPFQRFSF